MVLNWGPRWVVVSRLAFPQALVLDEEPADRVVLDSQPW